MRTRGKPDRDTFTDDGEWIALPDWLQWLIVALLTCISLIIIGGLLWVHFELPWWAR